MSKKSKRDAPARAASLMAATAHGKKVPADALNLLVMDHRQVQGWFDAYPGLPAAAKPELVRQICTALRAHTVVEEDLFYPAVREATGADDLIDHGLEEHAGAKEMIADLEGRATADAGMDETVGRLAAAIADHVGDEEDDLFPRVRASSLDLVELGARMTALRMAAFAEVTGRGHTALDRHPPESAAGPASLVEPDAAREAFVRGLRDAHAMEKQSETILANEIGRLARYPEVEARMQSHLGETRQQIERIERILEGMGQGTSAFREATASVTGPLGQLGLSSSEDEVLKGALASAAFENFEAAAYEQLLGMGELAGEVPAIRTLQQSLNEERAMVAWLERNNASLVRRFLELASAGRPAGR